MHHDIVERSPQMDVHTNTTEAIHDVGANMEVSSSDSLESPKSEQNSVKQQVVRRKFEQVPITKVQIQRVIVNNVSASNSSPTVSSPGASVIASATSVLPKTSSPVKCIVRAVPKDITVQPVTEASKPSPIATQFVKIAPQPQVTNLLRSPVHIWTAAANVTRIIPYPTTNSVADNKNMNAGGKASSLCLDCGVSPKPIITTLQTPAGLSANMREIERKFFKTGGVGIGRRRVNLDASTLSAGIPKGMFYGPKVTTAPTQLAVVNSSSVPNPPSKPPAAAPKRKTRVGNSRRSEPVCLTISSDDEEEESELKIPAPKKERITTQDKTQLVYRREMMRDKDGTLLPSEPGNTEYLSPSIYLPCRSIRIGSYKIAPDLAQPVIIEKEKVFITVPAIGDENLSISIELTDNDIQSVLAHLGKQMPAIFIYTTDVAAGLVRSRLNMTDKEGYYLDPLSTDESQKRITILPSVVDELQQQFLRSAFFGKKLSEIDHKVANMILVRSTANLLNLEQAQNAESGKTLASRLSFLARTSVIQNQRLLNASVPKMKPIENLLTYPPPPQTGGISVTSEDLECLKEGNFLNDVIIDFYLKYLVNEVLSERDKERTHVFSSFFYNCLTQKALHRDILETTTKSLSERRHKKVKTWTRHVDIFEKDFIIIPINQRAHWFLAIICFPGLVPELKEFPTNQKILTLPQPPPQQTVATGTLSQSSQSSQNESSINVSMDLQCPGVPEEDGSDPLASQLSLGAEEFAEEEESMQCDEQNYENSEEPIPPASEKSQPLPLPHQQTRNQTDHSATDGVVKRPCILIFDSLMGSSRWRIMSTLREYLSVEWHVKKGTAKIFSKTTMAGYSPQVPQQTNYSDCGIYLLQYVQSFFETPIKAYTQQMNLKDWFSTETVLRKRTEIQELIQRLSNEQRQERSDPSKVQNESRDSSNVVNNNNCLSPEKVLQNCPLNTPLKDAASLSPANQT